MSFANPIVLIVGAVLLVVAAWWSFFRRRHGALRISDGVPVRRVASSWWARLWRLPDVLRVVALSLLVVAVGRPQVPDRTELTGEGSDIIVALDMSGSMGAVDRTVQEVRAIQADGEEPLNRFETARDILEDFVGNRQEDRVGLIVFAEQVYLKFPLTLDYRVVLDQLEALVLDDGRRDRDPEECINGCTITGTGTALGDALARSFRRLRDSKAKTKAVVLITDGKREGGKLDPMTVANYIANQSEQVNVPVHTFLVGQSTGVSVPVRHRSLGLRGAQTRTVYQSADGQFSADPDVLRDIAKVTGGRFFEAYDEEQFRAQFAELEKTEFRTSTRTRKADVFLAWVIAGLLLLAFEWLLRLTVLRRFP